jgi:hypothetical protein
MARIYAGAMMVLFVVVVNILVTYMVVEMTGEGALPSGGFGVGCSDTTENATQCESQGKTAFIASLADVALTGFPEAPFLVNLLYVLLMGALLVVGLILIATGFIPLTSE